VSTSYHLSVPAPLLTTNRERSGHWHTRADIVRQTRESAYWLAKQMWIPAMEKVIVEFYPHQAKGRLADAGAHLPSAKAALDGIVDAGVLPDDSPKYVVMMAMHAPQRADKDRMDVVLVPCPTDGYSNDTNYQKEA
jgi:crossover junction endodeoxyribonuclease RusA